MSKPKKIAITVFSVVVILTAFIAFFAVQITDDLDYLANVDVIDVDLTAVEDGNYTGEYSCFPVTAIVEVLVENHEIIEITIISHKNGQGEAAEVIIEDVLENQTLGVDSIAGATYSSKVILLAIQTALESSID